MISSLELPSHVSSIATRVSTIIGSAAAKLLKAAVPEAKLSTYKRRKSGTRNGDKIGLTKSFLDKNYNNRPEEEWGTI